MVQETRKDPRAKVLTMTVRYKSATVDEFIEHHSYDISRGGIYIKTPSPFPPGTLLKFEIKIADDKPVLQGVGRVVWKREAPGATEERPAGMGVKFIKLDEISRQTIDKLVSIRPAGEMSAYDQEGDGSPAEAAPPKPRKATMMGLGAAVPDLSSTPAPSAAGSGSDASFFPASAGPVKQPPPEERTVMRQAAELLQEALREAGGSGGLDGVSDNPLFSGAKPEAPVEPSALKPTSKAPEPSLEALKPVEVLPVVPVVVASRDPLADKPESPGPARVAEVEAPVRPAKSESPAKAAAEVVVAKAAVEKRRVSDPPEPPAESSGGSGKIMIAIGVAAALAVGGYFYLNSAPPAQPAQPPPAVTSAAPIPAPTPTPTPMVSETAAPSATAPASASASASASAKPATSVGAPSGAKVDKVDDSKPAKADDSKPAKVDKVDDSKPAKVDKVDDSKPAKVDKVDDSKPAKVDKVDDSKPAPKPKPKPPSDDNPY